MARRSDGGRPFGREAVLELGQVEHLHVVAARIRDELPKRFPQREILRRRPFSFIGKKELIAEATRGWTDLHPLVSAFLVRPRFELDAKILDLHENDIRLALVVAVRTRQDIKAPLGDLVKAGIELGGLYVVRRTPVPGQRRLVGRFVSLAAGVVKLGEAFDDSESIPADEVWIEGSTASFGRCLRRLLGERYDQFYMRLREAESGVLTGPAMQDFVEKMGNFMRNAAPIDVGPGVICKVDERVVLANRRGYDSVVSQKSAEYCFDPAKSKRHVYAWPGLEKFGPYDRDSFSKKTPRILVVCPDKAAGQVSKFLKLFRDGISSVPNSAFSGGFARTFGLINPEFVECVVPLLKPGSALPAKAYYSAIEDHLTKESRYDAALVILLDEHARLAEEQSPYLRSKAALLMAGIPVQEAKLSTISKHPLALQHTLQNLAVALYAKLGGVPWTVDQDSSVDDEVVVGMGSAELSGSRFTRRQRYIGITTVFRGDGNYLLSNLSRECSYDEYPSVLKDTMIAVLREVKSRNGWRRGDTVRLVFHAPKPLKNAEIADIVKTCVDEEGKEQQIKFAFLTVNSAHPFRVIDTDQRGVPSRKDKSADKDLKAIYVPERGTLAQIGRYTRLLSTNGPTLIKRRGAPLPTPLLLHLHRQSTYVDQPYLAEQVLKFTCLSWRSTLPASRPVTIYYSELIADLLGRLRSVPDWSPMLLNVKLRGSKWFL